METQGELKLQKITNPLYLGNIAPNILKFVEKVQPVGITYETLYSYMAIPWRSRIGWSCPYRMWGKFAATTL
jgi:hypothetical protein